jgi:poly-beta-1,6-N-acetyl-D-glucosamine biosynthesis protein PgaD
MTSLIINMPHLQSSRQRHGAMLLSLLCWAWFLMPLTMVAAWMLGFRGVAQGIVWLGGWKSLLALAEFATSMIAALVAAWGLWTLFDMQRRSPGVAPVAPAIDAAMALGANPLEIAASLGARVVTVHFTPEGRVAAVRPETVAAPEAQPLPRLVSRRPSRRRRAA